MRDFPLPLARLDSMLRKVFRMAEQLASKAFGGGGKPKVLVIAGTTSVGKTDLSLELAKLLDGEVISADSVQVFRKLDIGSAKVEREVCEKVPHHLLDVADISQLFNSGDYCHLAEQALQDVIKRGRVPMVVGGTGLYIKMLMEGPYGAPPSTLESRARIDKLVEEEDGGEWEVSLSRLKSLDPVYAESLFPNDWYRLKRALEICTLSGRTVTSFKKEPDIEGRPYDFRCLFLSMARVELFHRIDARCELIIKHGLFDEVISLVRSCGLQLESQAGRSVGYRQALEYLKAVWGFPHQCGSSEAEDHVYVMQVPHEKLHQAFLDFLSKYKSKTRQLAQNQLGWFKKEAGFHWLNVAPRGERLPLEEVAKGVRDWFLRDTPLPHDWEGTSLQTLTPQENKTLFEYSGKHSKLTIFSDPQEVDKVLKQIDTRLNG